MSLLGLGNEEDKGWSAPESTQLMLIKITSSLKKKKARHSLNGVIHLVH